MKNSILGVIAVLVVLLTSVVAQAASTANYVEMDVPSGSCLWKVWTSFDSRLAWVDFREQFCLLRGIENQEDNFKHLPSGKWKIPVAEEVAEVPSVVDSTTVVPTTAPTTVAPTATPAEATTVAPQAPKEQVQQQPAKPEEKPNTETTIDQQWPAPVPEVLASVVPAFVLDQIVALQAVILEKDSAVEKAEKAEAELTSSRETAIRLRHEVEEKKEANTALSQEREKAMREFTKSESQRRAYLSACVVLLLFLAVSLTLSGIIMFRLRRRKTGRSVEDPQKKIASLEACVTRLREQLDEAKTRAQQSAARDASICRMLEEFCFPWTLPPQLCHREGVEVLYFERREGGMVKIPGIAEPVPRKGILIALLNSPEARQTLGLVKKEGVGSKGGGVLLHVS